MHDYTIRFILVVSSITIALHKRYYRLYGKYLSPHHLKAHIAKRKKLPKYAWWSALGAQAIQDIIERIDKGYQRFFQNLKDRQAHTTTQTIGPPTFRAIRKAQSFTLKQAGWKLLGGNRLRLGSTVYKFAKSREIEGTIKTVTVKRDALGDLYVFFSCVVVSASPCQTGSGQQWLLIPKSSAFMPRRMSNYRISHARSAGILSSLDALRHWKET
jgi:hypothetical protein